MKILEIKIGKVVTNPYVLNADVMKAGLPNVDSIDSEGIIFKSLEASTIKEFIDFLDQWDNKKTDEEQIAEDNKAICDQLEAKREEDFLKVIKKYVAKEALLEAHVKEEK